MPVYNVQVDTIYTIEADSPEDALCIIQEEPESAISKASVCYVMDENGDEV